MVRSLLGKGFVELDATGIVGTVGSFGRGRFWKGVLGAHLRGTRLAGLGQLSHKTTAWTYRTTAHTHVTAVSFTLPLSMLD